MPWRRIGSACIHLCLPELGHSWRRVISFTPRPNYPRAHSLRNHWIEAGKPQNRSERRGEEKILLLPVLELRPSSPYPVTILTMLSRLPLYRYIIWKTSEAPTRFRNETSRSKMRYPDLCLCKIKRRGCRCWWSALYHVLWLLHCAVSWCHASAKRLKSSLKKLYICGKLISTCILFCKLIEVLYGVSITDEFIAARV